MGLAAGSSNLKWWAYGYRDPGSSMTSQHSLVSKLQVQWETWSYITRLGRCICMLYASTQAHTQSPSLLCHFSSSISSSNCCPKASQIRRNAKQREAGPRSYQGRGEGFLTFQKECRLAEFLWAGWLKGHSILKLHMQFEGTTCNRKSYMRISALFWELLIM